MILTDFVLEILPFRTGKSPEKLEKSIKDLLWIDRVEICKRAWPLWVYLLLSQVKQELRGNSSVAYKYIPDDTVQEKKSFSWACLLWKLEGYLILAAMMLWNNLSLEQWGKAIFRWGFISWKAHPMAVWQEMTGCLGLLADSLSKHSLTCHGGNSWMPNILENLAFSRFLKVTRGHSLISTKGWALHICFSSGINTRHPEGKK